MPTSFNRLCKTLEKIELPSESGLFTIDNGQLRGSPSTSVGNLGVFLSIFHGKEHESLEGTNQEDKESEALD
jgi:hypothetical protein